MKKIAHKISLAICEVSLNKDLSIDDFKNGYEVNIDGIGKIELKLSSEVTEREFTVLDGGLTG